MVLFVIKGYTNSVEHLFKDPKKFQILDVDPTITYDLQKIHKKFLNVT